METFVLIYAILSGVGPATGTAEFGGKAACERAGAAVVDDWQGVLLDVGYVCVRKNGEEEEE